MKVKARRTAARTNLKAGACSMNLRAGPAEKFGFTPEGIVEAAQEQARLVRELRKGQFP